MAAKILDGKALSNKIKQDTKLEIISRTKQGIPNPCLAVILVGNNKASEVYVNNKKTACELVGIKSLSYNLSESTTTKELLELIEKLNIDKGVNGILVQLPLPKHIDTNLVIEAIDSKKDVDGFHPCNVGKLVQRNPILRPCTPYGIIKLLQHYNIELKGANAVIIGASNIVGRPMALELLLYYATVTVCHSATKNLEEIIKTADILIVATGNPKFIKAEHIKPGAVVVDVGINRLDNGKLVGDVDFDNALNVASYITPVPGGIGPMTVAMLLQNTLSAQKLII